MPYLDKLAIAVASPKLKNLLTNVHKTPTSCLAVNVFTRISCRWQTRATRCITANILQTNKLDAQRDQLATELSWQRYRTSIYPTHLHLAPPLRVTPFEFCRDFLYKKTRVPEPSCGVVCVILHLTVSVEHRLITDGRTDRQTDTRRQLILALATVARVKSLNCSFRIHKERGINNLHPVLTFQGTLPSGLNHQNGRVHRVIKICLFCA